MAHWSLAITYVVTTVTNICPSSTWWTNRNPDQRLISRLSELNSQNGKSPMPSHQTLFYSGNLWHGDLPGWIKHSNAWRSARMDKTFSNTWNNAYSVKIFNSIRCVCISNKMRRICRILPWPIYIFTCVLMNRNCEQELPHTFMYWTLYILSFIVTYHHLSENLI